MTADQLRELSRSVIESHAFRGANRTHVWASVLDAQATCRLSSGWEDRKPAQAERFRRARQTIQQGDRLQDRGDGDGDDQPERNQEQSNRSINPSEASTSARVRRSGTIELRERSIA